MLNKSCYEFLELLSSNAPVPGGGGASAFVGALGTALGTMVGNLTTGKKTYAANEESIQRLLSESPEIMKQLSDMVNGDAIAFEPLSAAYRMPAGSPEEKEAKEKAIQAGLPAAAEAPLSVVRLSVGALKLLDEYAHLGSRLAVSDAGTGAAFLKAAIMGAELNVLINLKSIKDDELRTKLSDELESLVNEGTALADSIFEYVRSECM